MIYRIEKLVFRDGETPEVDGEIVEVLSTHNATPGSVRRIYLTVLVLVSR